MMCTGQPFEILTWKIPSQILSFTRASRRVTLSSFFRLYRVGGYAIRRHDAYGPRKTKLLARVRRIRGQVEAIERALDGEAGCEQVMHLIAGARGAMAGLMAEVVEDHVRTHLVDPEKHPQRAEHRSGGAIARCRSHLPEMRIVMSENNGGRGGGLSSPCVPRGGARKERTQDMGGHLALRGHDGRGDCRRPDVRLDRACRRRHAHEHARGRASSGGTCVHLCSKTRR